MSNKYKSATAHCIAVMEEMKGSPMVDVVRALAQRVSNRKGEKLSVGEAKTAYVYLVKRARAPGEIDMVKAKRVAAAPKSAAPKAPADRLDVLKAAAKRAGIYRTSSDDPDYLTIRREIDAVTEEMKDRARVGRRPDPRDDPLGLAAPEKLTMRDLKELL